MNAKDIGNVEAAIEMPLDEIEGEIEQVNNSGPAAFQAGDNGCADLARCQDVQPCRRIDAGIIE